MLPIILDLTDARIGVVGGGPQAVNRLRMVDAAGAAYVQIFAVDPDPEMLALAGDRLVPHWPTEAEIGAMTILYVANVEDVLNEKFTAQARAQKTLINVEDVKPLCDFHVPSIVRRGDLLLSASTGGTSPGLARRLRLWLEERFPESWAGRLEIIGAAREQWRQDGASFAELNQKTNDLIDREGWLS